MPQYTLLAFLLFVSLRVDVHACLWDYDTLRMEREMFPGAHELIVGYFVRHSDEYYQWRIKDRDTKGGRKTPQDYDDIAVAYDKLGQQDKAIATIQEKMEKWPDQGTYESHANLGTFHIHNGQFKEGLVHIEKAIEINPNAHFGREIYQKLLVEYLIECGYPEKGLPLRKGKLERHEPQGFARFLLKQRHRIDSESNQVNQAIKGLLGMMRFGNHQSPVLLEVLGDLLIYGGYSNDAALLAARAYLIASYVTNEKGIAEQYQEKAEVSLTQQLDWTVEIMEEHLLAELKQGVDLFNGIKSSEAFWVAKQQDLDEEFYEKYSTIPKLKYNEWSPDRTSPERLTLEILMICVWCAFVILAVVLIFRTLKRKIAGRVASKPGT